MLLLWGAFIGFSFYPKRKGSAGPLSETLRRKIQVIKGRGFSTSPKHFFLMILTPCNISPPGYARISLQTAYYNRTLDSPQEYIPCLTQGLFKNLKQLLLVKRLIHKASHTDGLGPLKGIVICQRRNHHNPGIRMLFQNNLGGI